MTDIKECEVNLAMNVKELFDKAENGVLTYEQFEQLAQASNVKFADLSEGNYVSKSKYNDDLNSKNTQIETLNTTIQTRDADLASIKKQLDEAGDDSQKLSTLSTELSTLQNKYNTDIEQYKEQLAKQAYEFAGTQKFTSNAAKRDFIHSLIAENLKLNDKNEIMGANDFVSQYTEQNADAFVVENKEESSTSKTQPSFVQPTSQSAPQPNDNPFHFSFTGVRENKTN
jgi:hypothetical protein